MQRLNSEDKRQAALNHAICQQEKLKAECAKRKAKRKKDDAIKLREKNRAYTIENSKLRAKIRRLEDEKKILKEIAERLCPGVSTEV